MTEERHHGLVPAVAPSLLRTMNKRLLLDVLYSEGAATRPQLAKRAGLSMPTVYAALAELVEARLVRAVGSPAPASGRPAVMYEADGSAGAVAAVDIGREWLRVAITDLLGTPLVRTDARYHARCAEELVSMVGDAVQRAVADAGLSAAEITHTVIGAPGVHAPVQGQLIPTMHPPEWQHPALVEALRERIGELTVDNDANLAALGEYMKGAGQGAAQLVYMHVGTGVGLGIVIDGSLYRGFAGAAGEVRYTRLGAGEGPTLEASRRGPLEEAMAASAVVRYAQEAGMKGDPSAAEVFDAARSGSAPAKRAVALEARQLANLVAAISAFFNPELIVFGGGVGQNLDLLREPLLDELRHMTPFAPRFAGAVLGAESVLTGAIATGVKIARDLAFAGLDG